MSVFAGSVTVTRRPRANPAPAGWKVSVFTAVSVQVPGVAGSIVGRTRPSTAATGSEKVASIGVEGSITEPGVGLTTASRRPPGREPAHPNRHRASPTTGLPWKRRGRRSGSARSRARRSQRHAAACRRPGAAACSPAASGSRGSRRRRSGARPGHSARDGAAWRAPFVSGVVRVARACSVPPTSQPIHDERRTVARTCTCSPGGSFPVGVILRRGARRRPAAPGRRAPRPPPRAHRSMPQ